LTGAYLVPIAFVGAAAILSFVALRPDPYALADAAHDPMDPGTTPVRELIRRPTVAIVISGHTFGMYALSPLSGRLTDRFGSPTVIAAGLTVTASASILAAV